jgi:hypothetical protein
MATGLEAVCTEKDVFMYGEKSAQKKNNVSIVNLYEKEKRKRINATFLLL